MTPDDIKRLRALCEQATQPGPWTVNVNDIGKDGDGHCVVLDAHGMWVADCGNAPADAAFIAAARSALPALLDECEALRRQSESWRLAHLAWQQWGDRMRDLVHCSANGDRPTRETIEHRARSWRDQRDSASARAVKAEHDRDRLASECEALRRERDELAAERESYSHVLRERRDLQFDRERLTAERDEARAECERLRGELAAMAKVADEMEHDVSIVEQYRAARERGGQHVGTGGRLAALPPSGLSAIQRYARDIRAALDARKGES